MKITSKNISCILLGITVMLSGCREKPSNVKEANSLPSIYPDYIGVTIPSTIAPLNFEMDANDAEAMDVVVKGSKSGEIHSNGLSTDFDIDEWHQLTESNIGDSLIVSITAKDGNGWTKYKSFSIYVSRDDLEAYGLTYRRIAPGYEVYSRMGLYQRDLSSFDEEAIIDNQEVPGACVNCHTSNRTSNKDFLFHIRGDNGATLVKKGTKTELLNTKTDKTVGSLVYPYWHKEGRYVAFSSNQTHQTFHQVRDERIEVFDNASDIVVYDTETKELLYSALVNQTDSVLETFPVFSPDGKSIYYCAARPNGTAQGLTAVYYDLCKIDFDAENRKFGDKIDTIINMSDKRQSISHPRISYDGKYLMFTVCNYGTFPIWHKEADLWILNLETNEYYPIEEANSDDTDSFHNWSLDSHWFVFTSRRGDGLYTRLYIAHIDGNGKVGKPFLLPQKNPKEYYTMLLDSYNTPDFLTDHIDFDVKTAARKISSPERQSIKAVMAE